MRNRYLFLTGRLAESALKQILAELNPQQLKNPFEYEVRTLGISVASLMTPEFISRHLKESHNATQIILPGLCTGNITKLQEVYGIPVLKGPKDLKDLPEFFGENNQSKPSIRPDTLIFAEITNAPHLSIPQIIEQAKNYQQQGADVIDLGCLPNTPFPHLIDSIQALKAEGIQVSIDSLDESELLLAGRNGADFLLSLTEKTLWISEESASVPIIIPHRGQASLYRAIEQCVKRSKKFIADPILAPFPFGFTESIKNYCKLRQRYPQIQILMGTGNISELMPADTTGIHAILLSLCVELNIQNILTTAVSPHAKSAILEADMGWKMLKSTNKSLPHGTDLMALRHKKPFTYTSPEIQNFAKTIKDPSFRIQVNQEGIHIYNRDTYQLAKNPFALYSQISLQNDTAHAFYLGVQLARAEIAHHLGKRFIQDQALDWGVLSKDSNVLSKNSPEDSD